MFSAVLCQEHAITFLVCPLSSASQSLTWPVIPPSGTTHNFARPSSEVVASRLSLKGEKAQSVMLPLCPLMRWILLSNLRKSYAGKTATVLVADQARAVKVPFEQIASCS